jgi:hypothetical protein
VDSTSVPVGSVIRSANDLALVHHRHDDAAKVIGASRIPIEQHLTKTFFVFGKKYDSFEERTAAPFESLGATGTSANSSPQLLRAGDAQFPIR